MSMDHNPNLLNSKSDKPRLRKRGNKWFCGNAKAITYHASPQFAYELWKKLTRQLENNHAQAR